MTADEAIRAFAGDYTYCPINGQVFRDGKPRGDRPSIQGYLRLHIRRNEISATVYAHRLAWFLYYGELPSGEIDHINGDRADNRIANLRVVTACENRMNQRQRSDNSSGVTGVHPVRGRWQASICVRGQRKHLGTFRSLEAAAAARLSAQSRHEFGPNHGART